MSSDTSKGDHDIFLQALKADHVALSDIFCCCCNRHHDVIDVIVAIGCLYRHSCSSTSQLGS
jgi:hypothetical protein